MFFSCNPIKEVFLHLICALFHHQQCNFFTYLWAMSQRAAQTFCSAINSNSELIHLRSSSIIKELNYLAVWARKSSPSLPVLLEQVVCRKWVRIIFLLLEMKNFPSCWDVSLNYPWRFRRAWESSTFKGALILTQSLDDSRWRMTSVKTYAHQQWWMNCFGFN